jgi:hypothetical protein
VFLNWKTNHHGTLFLYGIRKKNEECYSRYLHSVKLADYDNWLENIPFINVLSLQLAWRKFTTKIFKHNNNNNDIFVEEKVNCR